MSDEAPVTAEEIREALGEGVDRHASLTRKTFAEAMRGEGAHVRGVEFDCNECGKVGYHKPGCAVEAKRLAMQMQLDRVTIDQGKLKDRSAPRRTVEVIAHDVRRKLLERAESLLDHNDLDNAVTLINAAKGLT